MSGSIHMPDEDRARIVERAKRRINEWNTKRGHGRSVDPMFVEEHGEAIMLRDLVVAIQCLEKERDEARLLVTEANNSLYGSQGYFHSLNGGPFDKYHLATGIERLKATGRAYYALQREAAEALAPFKSGWMTSDTEHTARTVVAHMHPERQYELHLSSEDFLRASALVARLSRAHSDPTETAPPERDT